MVQTGAELTEAETCPHCGSGKLVLQGRVVEGQTVRELACRACRQVWRIELPAPRP